MASSASFSSLLHSRMEFKVKVYKESRRPQELSLTVLSTYDLIRAMFWRCGNVWEDDRNGDLRERVSGTPPSARRSRHTRLHFSLQAKHQLQSFHRGCVLTNLWFLLVNPYCCSPPVLRIHWKLIGWIEWQIMTNQDVTRIRGTPLDSGTNYGRTLKQITLKKFATLDVRTYKSTLPHARACIHSHNFVF